VATRYSVRTVAALAAIASSILLIAPAVSAAKPKCFGKRATKVGHGKIVGTPHKDVIVGLGGRNKIIGKGGADVICGGRGNDRITLSKRPNRPARDGPSILIGGPGNDFVRGGYRDDLLIGDCASIRGDATCNPGRDDLEGQFGGDREIGDNYSRRGDATGGADDVLRSQNDDDTLIGDSAVDHGGTAVGGGRDHFEASSDKDLVIGDSYSRSGIAIGGGDDGCAKHRADRICQKHGGHKRDAGEPHKPALNGGPAKDTMVGDSYTVTGYAEGSGDDDLKEMGPGSNKMYGDSLAKKPAGEVSGGGEDTLNGASGNELLSGGPAADNCRGRDGRNTFRNCERVRKLGLPR
jgi:Ca2+-binding RTX toxin-like protein